MPNSNAMVSLIAAEREVIGIFKHPKRKRALTISGKLGEDAEKYQIRDVKNAIKEVEGK